MLIIGNQFSCQIQHMHFCTAFLNAELNDVIFMTIPKYYQNDKNKNTCLKLNKAIYGLRQSSRNWNNCIHSYSHITLLNLILIHAYII